MARPTRKKVTSDKQQQDVACIDVEQPQLAVEDEPVVPEPVEPEPAAEPEPIDLSPAFDEESERVAAADPDQEEEAEVSSTDDGEEDEEEEEDESGDEDDALVCGLYELLCDQDGVNITEAVLALKDATETQNKILYNLVKLLDRKLKA